MHLAVRREPSAFLSLRETRVSLVEQWAERPHPGLFVLVYEVCAVRPGLAISDV